MEDELGNQQVGGQPPQNRVEVDERDIRDLENNLRLLKDRNRDFAKNIEKFKMENLELREYAEKCKMKGEIKSLREREDAYNRALSQAAMIKRDRVRARDIPYRKPDIYKTGENFKRWLKSFKVFADTAQIPQDYRINTLITFLDAAAQMKVETLHLSDEKKRDPNDCYEQISRAIEGTTLKNECRARLFKLKQGPNDSVTEFATQLVDLAERVYDEENSPIKGQIMLDCFIAGLRSDRLAYDLIKEEFDTFQTAYQRALDLESIYALRDRTGHRETDSDNLFEIRDTNENTCTICGKRGHVWKTCFRLNCNKCGQAGHVAEMCQNGYIKQQGQGRQMGIECWICGKRGHISRECRSRNSMYRPNGGPRVGQKMSNIGQLTRNDQRNNYYGNRSQLGTGSANQRRQFTQNGENWNPKQVRWAEQRLLRDENRGSLNY